MLFWFAVALPFVVAGAMIVKDEGDDAGGAFLATAAAVWLAWFIVTAIATDRATEAEPLTKDLVALNDAKFERSEMGGAFVLIAGAVNAESDEEFRYTWYERAADGGLRLRSENADTDEITIYEDAAGEQPTVVELVEVERKETPGWAAPFDLGAEPSHSEGFELHVPRGSVVRDFELDAR